MLITCYTVQYIKPSHNTFNSDNVARIIIQEIKMADGIISYHRLGFSQNVYRMEMSTIKFQQTSRRWIYKTNLIFWHRLVFGFLQNLHSPHCGTYNGITWSPKHETKKHQIATNNLTITNKTRGQSNLTKSASRGAHSPVRGHPRGSKVVPLNSWGRVSY